VCMNSGPCWMPTSGTIYLLVVLLLLCQMLDFGRPTDTFWAMCLVLLRNRGIYLHSKISFFIHYCLVYGAAIDNLIHNEASIVLN